MSGKPQEIVERGPGVSGVVRIEEALALLEENRSKATGTPPPATLLPVEPLTPYPVEGLKAVGSDSSNNDAISL